MPRGKDEKFAKVIEQNELFVADITAENQFIFAESATTSNALELGDIAFRHAAGKEELMGISQ